MATINARGVSFSFGPSLVLSGIDLTVAPGQRVGVVGQPSRPSRGRAAQDLAHLEPAVDEVPPRTAEAQAAAGLPHGLAVEPEEQEQVARPDAAPVEVPLRRRALAEGAPPAGRPG